MQAPPAHPIWIALLAAVGGLLIPAAAAIAAAVLLGPPSVAHASQLAKLAGAALTAAEAIFAGLGAAALVEAGWRRVGLPGSGPANFLPLRYARHRLANKHVKELIEQLRTSPAQPSRESLRALLDLSREMARRDIYTRAHSGRVSRLCVELGQRIGLSPEDCEIARLAGLLHDIGKLEIPSSILNKPGPLDPDEAELVRNHPAIGAALVAPYIGADVVNAVRHHHERVDGAGYPDGVDSDALPIIARLVPVVDTYDALISDRSYRPGRSREEAFVELRAVAGTQLDAELVDALIEMESAKVPFGGAVLGLAPMGALLRRTEHLLHNSAAPAAAAITAIAVAGAGWLGVMSGNGAQARTANGTDGHVSTGPSPTASANPNPDQSPGAAQPLTTPTGAPAPPSGPQVPIFFYSGNKNSGTFVAPKTTKTSSGSPSTGGSKSNLLSAPTVITVGSGPAPLSPSPGGNNQPPPPPPPAPTVSSISPASGPVGTSVTISGTNFSTANAVDFGAWGATISSRSATTIVALAPPGSGQVYVTVTNPGGSSAKGLMGDSFTYVGPDVTSISGDGTAPSGAPPDAFGPASGGTPLTISGTNLSGATSVSVGASACPITSNTNTTIVCTAPAYAGNAREPVLVTTPAGGPASPSDGGQFNYGPNVTSVSPKSGGAGTQVKIAGSNLSGAIDATFDGITVAITVNSDTSAMAKAPAPDASGAVDVGVDNDAGPSATGRWDRFTWNRPQITSVSPGSGSAGSGVTISGSGFTGAVNVYFGSSPATFSFNSDSSITATVPAISPGTVSVTVATPAGTSGGVAYTVTVPGPTIQSITPNTGVSTTATTVVIGGQNLGGATSVTFGTASAIITPNTNSATSITVVVPPSGVDGPVTVTLTTPYGTATVPNGFTWTG
ncbi:MAG TPA: IPT/TIG domain-containing protein [Actinomycetota bacterium]|nr:IPT/TIG domain-containing protein [Actinomycetota bacterium]